MACNSIGVLTTENRKVWAGLRKILSQLWVHVVSPIFKELGFEVRHTALFTGCPDLRCPAIGGSASSVVVPIWAASISSAARGSELEGHPAHI